jgi:hypothetical protein
VSTDLVDIADLLGICHLRPFLVLLLWPGYGLASAAATYATMLVMVSLVGWVPHSLARPVGMTLAAAGVVAGTLAWTLPEGLAWLPTLYFLKLVAGHAVPPEQAAPGRG